MTTLRRCKLCGVKPVGRRHGGKCHGCAQKIWRRSHPVEAAYAIKKWNAKRAGQTFRLTPLQWLRVAEARPGPWPNPGQPQSGADWTLDRIQPHLGYVEGNLQWLTRQENSHWGAKPKLGQYSQNWKE